MHEYLLPGGECERKIAISHAEREARDNLLVKNEQNNQFRQFYHYYM